MRHAIGVAPAAAVKLAKVVTSPAALTRKTVPYPRPPAGVVPYNFPSDAWIIEDGAFPTAKRWSVVKTPVGARRKTVPREPNVPVDP